MESRLSRWLTVRPGVLSGFTDARGATGILLVAPRVLLFFAQQATDDDAGREEEGAEGK